MRRDMRFRHVARLLSAIMAVHAALAAVSVAQQVPTTGAAAPAASPAGSTAAAGSQAWTAYQQQGTGVAYGSGAKLDGVMTHVFRTPLDDVQASHVFAGSSARLRRVVSDLQNGSTVKLVAIGGAATNGSAASQPGSNDYVAQFAGYLMRAFPTADVQVLRHSAGVAPSAVVAYCSDRFVVDDADLVLLEMVQSDGAALDNSIIDPTAPQGYEVLIRKILQGSKQPAVILTQLLAPGMGNGTAPYYLTPEAPQYAALATFYNLPYASLRNAVWSPAASSSNATEVLTSVQATDGATPVDAGHDAITDMLVFKVQQAAQDLALIPYGDYDASALNADVPSPMYQDVRDKDEGTVLANASCLWIQAVVQQGCPSSLEGACDADYSSYDAARRTWGDSISTSSGSGLSQGAIIGIAVGCAVAGLAVIGLAAWLCIRRRAAADAARPIKQAKRPVTSDALPSRPGADAHIKVNGDTTGRSKDMPLV